MSTQEWDLNVSRLVGETNDGVPHSLTMRELKFALDVGSVQKTKFVPLPGEKRRKKQQERTGRWRAKKHHQKLCKAVRPTWRSAKKPSSPQKLSGIKNYMKKLEPTHAELEARVSKDWTKLKKGYKKIKLRPQP